MYGSNHGDTYIQHPHTAGVQRSPDRNNKPSEDASWEPANRRHSPNVDLSWPTIYNIKSALDQRIVFVGEPQSVTGSDPARARGWIPTRTRSTG